MLPTLLSDLYLLRADQWANIFDMLSRMLEKSLHRALAYANERRH